MSKSLSIRTRFIVGSAAALLTVLIAAPATAHHSFAMYDQAQTLTFTGRVTRFIPGANHAQILFEVIGKDGKTELGPDGKPLVWGIEMGPAANIARSGVTVAAFPNGTIITASLHPLRNGKTFGAMSRDGSGLIKCGSQLPKDGCNAKTGEAFLTTGDGNGDPDNTR
jgi:uncharacterized protein DUF6152